MTIEFLYPELCNLYGDRGNMDYLRRCLPADYHETNMGQEPWFVQHEVDLIYMCSMTERSQERIIEALAPYRERLKELIAGGTHFLLTGNAMEVFGKTIQDGEKTIPGLGLLDLTARRILPRRVNSLFLGGFEGAKIVGYTSRFSHMESSLPPLFSVEKGLGRSENAAEEGIRSGGVLGTYLLGPLLVLNPDFTRWLLDDLGAKDAPLAFEEEVRQAYKVRLEQFQGNIEF
jgi:CobQ-like glutamine amidotransferase family enzyme